VAIARHEGFSPIVTLAFDYGQRHRHELTSAQAVSRHLGAAEHRVLSIDLRQFGNSALTGSIDVPKDRDPAHLATGEVPATYVPARNTIFLSYALALAEVIDCDHVFIGVNALDYSGYPDCRPEFVKSFAQTARLGTRRGNFTIHAPLIDMTKSQIIRTGLQLGVDYSITHSCYDPDERGRACGRCDSCLLRRRGFEQAGVPDPTIYA
jgi:7-cyano-7-deazaguanine synthase